MTRRGVAWFCAWLTVGLPSVACAAVDKVDYFGEPDRLHLVGASSFQTSDLKTELLADPEIVVASYPAEPLAAYCELLSQKLQLGYLAGGFPDAAVDTAADRQSRRLVVTIREGPRLVAGELRIRGCQKLPEETLREWFVALHRGSATWSVNPDQPEGERRRQWLTQSRVAAELEPPVWTPGSPVNFSPDALQHWRKLVEWAYAELGLFWPRFEIELKRDPAHGTADLIIHVQDEGPAGVVGEIEIAGAKKNHRDDLLKYLDLEAGRVLTLDERTRLQRRLWRSARFIRAELEVTPGADPKAGVQLKITLVEYPQAPALTQPLTAEDEAVLTFRDWLVMFARRGEDLLFRSSDGHESYNIVLAADDGVLWQMDGRDPLKPETGLAMVVSPNHLGCYWPERERKLSWKSAGVDLKLKLIHRLEESPADPSKPFAMFLSLFVPSWRDTVAAQRPLEISLDLAPVAYLAMLREANARATLADGILSVESDNLRLRSQADTGRPLQLVVTTDDDRFEFRQAAPGLFRHTLERIQTASAKVQDSGDDKLPLTDWLKFELIYEEQLDEAELSPEQLSGVRSLDRMLDAGILRPLDELAVWALQRKKSPFSIALAERSSRRSAEVDWGPLAVHSGCALVLGDRVFPSGSWAAVLWREACLATVDQNGHFSETVQQLLNSGTCGPLGYLALAEMMVDMSMPVDAVAERGLARLTLDDFRNDYRMLLVPESACGKCLLALAAALVDLPDDQADALVALFKEEGLELGELIQPLRDRSGRPLEAVLPAVLDGLWAAGLRDDVAAEFKSILSRSHKLRSQKIVGAGAAQLRIAELTEALRFDPLDAETFGLRGQAWYYANDLEKALSDFAEAIQLDPQLGMAYGWRGIVRAKQDDDDAALADLSRAIELGYDESEVYQRRGFVYAERRDWDHAVADYNEAIRLDPGDEYSYGMRGYIYAEQNKHEKALRDFDEALQRRPDWGWIHRLRAYSLEAVGRLDEAVVAYGAVLNTDEADVAIFVRRGRLCRQQGRYREALTDFEVAIRLSPLNWRAWNELAWLRAIATSDKFRDSDQALHAARQACLFSQWKRADPIEALAAACAEAGQFDDAARYQSHALALAPDDHTARMRLGYYRDHKNYYGKPVLQAAK